jgi:hypothetical protein
VHTRTLLFLIGIICTIAIKRNIGITAAVAVSILKNSSVLSKSGLPKIWIAMLANIVEAITGHDRTARLVAGTRK